VSEDLAQLKAALGNSGPILLDFDGPICGVFSAHPAPVIAKALLDEIEETGVPIPADLQRESDPMEVLKWSALVGSNNLVRRVDDALRSAELVAVQTSAPTPFASEIIISAKAAQRPVAIVSNNSAEAVRAYLDRHGLSSYVSPVVGAPTPIRRR